MKRYYNAGRMHVEPVRGRGPYVLTSDAAELAKALKEARDLLAEHADYNGAQADRARYDALLTSWEDET